MDKCKYIIEIETVVFVFGRCLRKLCIFYLLFVQQIKLVID